MGGETVFLQLIHVEMISIKLPYQPIPLWGATYIMGYHKMCKPLPINQHIALHFIKESGGINPSHTIAIKA